MFIYTMCVCVCARDCRCSWSPEGAVASRSRVTHMVVSRHGGAGNQTPVLSKSSTCSYLLSTFLDPRLFLGAHFFISFLASFVSSSLVRPQSSSVSYFHLLIGPFATAPDCPYMVQSCNASLSTNTLRSTHREHSSGALIGSTP